MKISIYQAPFTQTCMGFQMNANYALVWTEEVHSMDVDKVWTRFQRVEEGIQMPPEGYEGRSLSVGDVVALDGDLYTPEPLGWRRLTVEESSLVEISALTCALAASFEMEKP